MLDTAIIGGGLCGLILARRLQAEGVPFALFEARERLGGRILTTKSGADLGSGWIWPQRQPLIAALLAELGLATFPQHDEGTVLYLREADKRPDVAGTDPVHGGAARISGGAGRLVAALARDMPAEMLRLGHVLTTLTDRGDHVSLVMRHGEERLEVEARHVVLALPPRLVAERIRFTPAPDAAVTETLRNTKTWMASHAKVVISYGQAPWREAGLSGNAFVTHEQAVLGEVFDACDESGSKAALGGFLAFSPALRKTFGVGLPMLMNSQMAQLFGPAVEQGEQLYQDWAEEPFTCSALDIEDPATELAGFVNPLLRRAQWDGKLHFGATETASNDAGHLEGAIEAAGRIERQLLRERQAAIQSAPEGDVNAASLGRFRSWVASQTDCAFDGYRQRLSRSLALQQREQLTQRAVLESIEEVYREALQTLEALPFDTKDVAVERGRSALTPEVQAPFRHLMQSLIDDVIAFNRTSCALSNFPDEHHPPREYMQTIMRDIAAAWREFSLSANALLLAKRQQAR